jgi:hypothetical protein
MDALPHLAKTDSGELHTKTSLGQVRGCVRAPPLVCQGLSFDMAPCYCEQDDCRSTSFDLAGVTF